MRLVTSFSPSRIERQQVCLESWLESGFKVTGVQSPGEAEVLRSSFPGAELVETDLVGDLFNRPKLVRIKPMADLAIADSAPVLIINSDIDIRYNKQTVLQEWSSCPEKTLKVGIRWNYDIARRTRQLFKWGIDIFLVTPEIAGILPDIGMTMGCPAWDYWIPWHLHYCGFSIETRSEMTFFHNVHHQNWSKEEYAIGLGLMQTHYGVGRQKLADFIQLKTKRRHLRK